MQPLPQSIAVYLAGAKARVAAQIEADKHRAAQFLDYANRTIFERECAVAGIDPATGISPTLMAKLTAHRCWDEEVQT